MPRCICGMVVAGDSATYIILTIIVFVLEKCLRYERSFQALNNKHGKCFSCLFVCLQNEIIQFNMCHLNAIVTQKVYFERPRHDPGSRLLMICSRRPGLGKSNMTNVASSLSLMQIESLKTETNTEPGEMCSLEQLESMFPNSGILLRADVIHFMVIHDFEVLNPWVFTWGNIETKTLKSSMKCETSTFEWDAKVQSKKIEATRS